MVYWVKRLLTVTVPYFLTGVMMKVFGIWVFVVGACFAWVKLTAIGPVILTISAKHGWGVHSGDLVLVVPAFLVGILGSVRLLKKS